MNLVITRDKPIKNNLTYVGEPPHFSGMLMLKSAPQINCPASDASSANPAAFEDLQGLRSCKAAKVDANYDGNGMKWHDHAWSMESMAIWCVEMSGKFIYMGISSEYRAYHIHYHYSQELHKGLWPYNLWKSICNMKMAKKKNRGPIRKADTIPVSTRQTSASKTTCFQRWKMVK